jgi:hypothetical protein
MLEMLEDRIQPSGTSTITSNFNGTPIPPGSTVWFNSVAKVSGVGSSPVQVEVVNASVTFTANGTLYTLAVPNADLTFSPTATTATTAFDTATNTWETTVPTNPGGGNVFLSGVALPAPSGLPRGINPVSWTATFQTNTAGVTLNWQWGAAVYTSFSSDYNALNVKPVDDDHISVYHNSDHAGTPEAFRSFVIGGARGGGGSNWTGSYSGTASVRPDVVTQPAPSSLSGFVYIDNNGDGMFDTGDTALSSVTVTLTGINDLGQTVTMTATTDQNGFYHFDNLRPGTYTITQTPLANFQEEVANVGSVGGSPSTGQVSGITLAAGTNGVNYDFGQFVSGGGT